MKDLELRMYGLTPYALSSIQSGIQFGHAVVEYGQMSKSCEIYNSWADNWKTVIILNGGTTNDKIKNGVPIGTLNRHALVLHENGIEFTHFNEPDLGDQLTAVCFIVDERVFNHKKYPEFQSWVIENYGDLIRDTNLDKIQKIRDSQSKNDKKVYKEWVKFIGGKKNVFLRDFLKSFDLAR